MANVLKNFKIQINIFLKTLQLNVGIGLNNYGQIDNNMKYISESPYCISDHNNKE